MMPPMEEEGHPNWQHVGRLQVKRLSAIALVGMAAVACGSTTGATGTPDPAASAHLMSFDQLAAGQLGSLPTGSQFARIVMFQQAPLQGVKSKKHQAGFIYVETGRQRLTYANGQSFEIDAGMAKFLSIVEHTHTTLGPTSSTWYFIAVWESAQRPTPLTVPGSHVAFDTMDIPSSTLRPGAYTETLRRVTLQTGGRSPAHSFGGLEVVYVLDGTLTVRVAGLPPVTLTQGGLQGAYVAPNTVTQELNTGSSKVDYLAFFVTPQRAPFETYVTRPPSA
jgi:quercetin dioxygenase-like cupin family protein